MTNSNNKYVGNSRSFDGSISIFLSYIVLILSVYILPSLKVRVPYIIAASGMLVLIPIVWNKCRWLTNDILLLILLSGLIMISSTVMGTYSLVESVNEAIRNIRFFLPGILAVYVLNCCNVKHSKMMLVIFCIIVGYIWYQTSTALAEDQWITRILAKSTVADTSEIRAYRLQNIGGFEFSHLMGVLTICFFWLVFHSQRKITRILACIATIGGFIYIIQTMYTTLLLLTSICILFIFIVNIRSKQIRAIVVALQIAVLFILPRLFSSLSGLFGDSLLTEKFQQISSALSGGGLDELGSRPEKVLYALSNWLSSPIFGGNMEGVSSHSLVVGILVSNGIVGLAVWGYLFLRVYKRLKKELTYIGVSTQLTSITFLFVLMLSCFNSIGYVFEVTWAAFFIAPICSWVCECNNA